VVIIFTTSLFGQYPIDLKSGLYNSLEDIIKNNPQFECKFNVKHRTTLDIQMWGGNDYKVSSDTTNVINSAINKCFAVFNGDTLFINGKHINGSLPFCKVENNGRFLIIKAGIPNMAKRKSVGYKSNMTHIDYVPIGGAIGGAATGAQLAMIRFYYILDCKNGGVKILSKDYLNSLLSDFPNLKAEFESDKKTSNQTELLKYIKRMNE